MDRVFKSKVGWWYHLVILLAAAGCVASILKGRIDATVISLLASMLIIHILLNTWYKITEDGVLVAHCSIFPEKRIAISEITALGSTVMPISSYALSLDRLIIYKNDKYWLLISPVDKKDFISQLIKINPEIKLRNSDI